MRGAQRQGEAREELEHQREADARARNAANVAAAERFSAKQKKWVAAATLRDSPEMAEFLAAGKRRADEAAAAQKRESSLVCPGATSEAWKEVEALAAAEQMPAMAAAAKERTELAARCAERQRESAEAAAAATKRAADGQAEADWKKLVEEARDTAEMRAAAKKKKEALLPWSAAWKEAEELAAVRRDYDEQILLLLLGTKKKAQLLARSRLDKEEAASNKYVKDAASARKPLNPQPSTLNPKPYALNPKSGEKAEK